VPLAGGRRADPVRLTLRSIRLPELIVQNYFTIETEVAHRRFEWERTVASVEQCALVRPSNGREHWSRLPHLVLARLHSLTVPRRTVTSWTTGLEERTRTLEGGRVVGT
jgi:hypothetical protein